MCCVGSMIEVLTWHPDELVTLIALLIELMYADSLVEDVLDFRPINTNIARSMLIPTAVFLHGLVCLIKMIKLETGFVTYSFHMLYTRH